MPLRPLTRLGRYEILGLLGAGGMGEVYRAHDLQLHRDVAIKVLPESMASSPERLARLQREARTVASLNHPNIVTLHSMEEEDGVRFLTLELVEGQTLTALLTGDRLPIRRVLELTIPLADALAAAHERNVIHRDLKPGNVMVTPDGRVKVLDFGLARAAPGPDEGPARQSATTTPLTTEGAIVGTLPYMAPEQVRGEAADARTDLFALGIIVYELVAGRRPFAGATTADLTSSILRDPPPPLGNVRRDVPMDLERMINRCLEKAPRQRIQTALDVGHELRRIARSLEQGEPRHAPPRVGSIAVLPFANRSRDEADEYFSDGLADELLVVLTKIPGLSVAARTSSFQFRSAGQDPAIIGRKLNVGTLLEGTVRKAGDRVRISVALVNAADGFQLWSGTYDRTLDDIFAVQDDIARSVVRELRASVLGQEPGASDVGEDVAQAVRGRGHRPEAHRMYLKARHFIDRVSRENVLRAVEYLKEAVALDPAFALAWAEQGRAYTTAAAHGWLADGYRLGREAAARALALEPDLAEGHAVMAWIQLIHDWDWQGAERSVQHALALAPGNTSVLRRAGVLAWTQGRFEETMDRNRRVIELDPLNAVAYHNLGLACHATGRLTEAEDAYKKAIEIAPGRSTEAFLALLRMDQGRAASDLEQTARGAGERYGLWSLAIIHQAEGRAEDSAEELKRLTEEYSETMAFEIAEVHAMGGRIDLAFEWLERALDVRAPMLCDVKVSRRLAALHADPRWVPLLKKMGLEAPR